MLLVTTETLPQGCVITDVFSLVWAYQSVNTSDGTSQLKEAFDLLIKNAPEGTNAIIGINVSTTSQHFSNGTFLYVTVMGTPVIYKVV